MLTTCGTVVGRGGHQDVNRATGAYIAKVVQGALVGCVARGEMPTSGAGGLLIVTAIKSQLGCWEVLDVDNALGGVWHVFTRSKHGWLPWKKGWDQSIKVITCPVYIESRIPATVSTPEQKAQIREWANVYPKNLNKIGAFVAEHFDL